MELPGVLTCALKIQSNFHNMVNNNTVFALNEKYYVGNKHYGCIVLGELPR